MGGIAQVVRQGAQALVDVAIAENRRIRGQADRIEHLACLRGVLELRARATEKFEEAVARKLRLGIPALTSRAIHGYSCWFTGPLRNENRSARRGSPASSRI